MRVPPFARGVVVNLSLRADTSTLTNPRFLLAVQGMTICFTASAVRLSQACGRDRPSALGTPYAGMWSRNAHQPVPLPVQALDHATGYRIPGALPMDRTIRRRSGRRR